MKPISLHGHEKAITQIKYNREGDLLFSCSKDRFPNVWYSINGERLGTYDGHTGAVWCLDVDWETKFFLSGAADNSVRLWDVETGKLLNRIDTNTVVRTCGFSYSGSMVAFSTDKQMGHPCLINIVDSREFTTDKAIMSLPIPPAGPKVTSMLWSGLDTQLITGHENGDVVQWDIRTHKKSALVALHQKNVSDLQLSSDGTMLITSSKDSTAKLLDTETLKCLKTYKTDRPVNSASISPKFDHVVLGGGQEAMDVTTTSTKIGKFDAKFFHLIFEDEEFARVKGHFGPINSVMFHPDGNSYASGGEDGYVRINVFDPSYFDFNLEHY